MTLHLLLARLRNLDVQLRVEGDLLRFNAPKGVMTPELRVELAAQKGEILAFLRDVDAHVAAAHLAISPGPRGEAIPLSFAQQRLWFLNQFEPRSAAYNVPLAVSLTGTLNSAALAASLAAVVARHEVLRTTFAAVAGEPVQTIHAALAVPVPLIDLSDLPAAERTAQALRLAQVVAELSFDLVRGPLLQARLLRLAREEHWLLLSMHHIVSDGWSMNVLVRELSVLYDAHVHRRPVALPALPVQYADYAHWQREWLQGPVLERQLGYWREHLGRLATLNLPTDRPRLPVQRFEGAVLTFHVPATLMAQLQTLSRAEGVTSFMTLLAAFQTLLYRYSGQEDIMVGSPIAGRTQVETEGLIGLFVNTLVLRSDLSGNPRFRDLLGRVREVCLGAYAHQEVPFERLVEELQPVRDLSRTPLFQVMFVLQNAPFEPVTLPELRLEPVAFEQTTAKFDLTLTLVERPEGLHGSLEYSTALFDAASIDRLACHLQQLLTAIVADPDQRLAALPLLPERERSQLLVAWNATQVPYPAQARLQQLFEAQVARTPEAVAVVCEDAQLSYAALDVRATRLACYLSSLGVGPEVRVGLCTERDLEMVVGVLGILKAGGAYVPLDPSHPSERLNFILSDARVAVVVTQAHLHTRLPIQPAPLLDLETVWAAPAPRDAAVSPLSTAAQSAYVIYTSGSTGWPKGVRISHQALVNVLMDLGQRCSLSVADRMLALTTITFDIAGLELYLPLLAGACVEIAPSALVTDGEALAHRLALSGTTLLQATPATWRLLLAAAWQGKRDLRLLCGGEALPLDLAQRLVACGTVLWNLYGPTETTIWSSAAVINPQDMKITLGRPLANTQTYVLDAALQPTPIGVPGELYIGGTGLALGYLARPGLTAERFIPHPFSLEPDRRVYRTGDLARYLPDGSLEYLGRLDHQVKMRGFRIELGEIEAALLTYPGASAAAVVAQAEQAGEEPRLVAYLVMEAGCTPTPGDLRAHLQRYLPGYMVPAAFVLLETLPLTPSGKIDRRALPAVGATPLAHDGDGVAPRTPTEELVAGIWAQVLRLARVGVYENFFELGGHSLLATQVMARIRAAVGLTVPLQRLFEQPTIAGLAAAIYAEQRGAHGQLAPPLVPVTRSGMLALSFSQERLWFLDALAPGNNFYNFPVSVRLRGPLHLPTLAHSLGALCARHEVLRTTYASVGGQPFQVIGSAGQGPLPLLDLSALTPGVREAELEHLLQTEHVQPFDLARGPLLRLALVRLVPAEHLLLGTVHHSIFDRWSLGIFARDLTALYDAILHDRPAALPDLPVQYADFTAWQRAWLHGDVLESELSYWRQQLAGAPELLALPTDRPRPPVQTFAGATVSRLLSASLAASLQALSRQESVTLFMTLLGGLQILLWRYSGQDDMSVGTFIAGRTREETAELIGFFVNNLVLRTDLSGDPTVQEFLARVRMVTLGAYTHQDVPFEKVVQSLQRSRDRSYSPLFQVMLVLQNAPIPPVSLADLTVQIVPTAITRANFDLTLWVVEGPDGLQLDAEYNTDLFEAETIERLLDHFQTLLEGMVAQPRSRIGSLPLAAAEQPSTPLDAVALTPDLVPARCLHQLFEARAARMPTAVAVACEMLQVTYAALDRRANQLAHCLRELGVGPEVRVGLFLPLAVERVEGTLGILKAGGCVVEIDPSYPAAQLPRLLREARVAVLVSLEALASTLALPEVTLLLLDRDASTLARAQSGPVVCSLQQEHLAHIRFLHPLMARPLAVGIDHAAAVAGALTFQEEYGLVPGDRVLQVTRLGVGELASVLGAGATLVLSTDTLLTRPAAFWQACADRHVTAISLPGSTWQQLGGELDRRAVELPTGVRLVLVTADGLQSDAVGLRPHRPGGHASIVALYGLIETSGSVMARVVPEEPVGPEWPLGHALPHAQLYVLNHGMHPVPQGDPGELYIGGASLARCYLDQPALTAGRFLPHPFASDPGLHLIQTGVRVHRLPDRSLAFLGVITKWDEEDAGTAATTPAAQSVGKPRRNGSVMPRTPIEATLCAIWSDVLGCEPLGIYDDFFDLGGTPQLASVIMARVCQAYQVNLSSDMLDRAATIAGLAEAVEMSLIEQTESDLLMQLLAQVEGSMELGGSRQRD